MSLPLAPGLDLPDDFATQGTAIIGVRGSGKSNTEVRYAELLHAAGIPFVAVDPKGDWHGIRMQGTGPGLPVPVFGGLYGDFPLTEDLGARIADLLVNENLSAVLDVSRLSKTVGLPRFLTAFCDQLMDRHQKEPHVRCVILEEAHRYIPQNVTGKTAALKEAAASLLLEGRAFGLGCWACTQRPARLHNDVLEEVDTAVIHRIGVTATADLKRVREWVKHEDLGPEIGESLTKLRNGEAWVLSPVALEVVQRVQVDRRRTFDSGATPTVGAAKRTVATMADIDTPAIKEALADAIEKAKETDPRALQSRVRDLERHLSAAEARLAERAETVEVPVVPIEVQAAVGESHSILDAIHQTCRELDALHGRLLLEMVRIDNAAVDAPQPVRSTPAETRVHEASGRVMRRTGQHTWEGVVLSGAPARIAAALARFPGGLTKRQIAAHASIVQKTSTMRNALSSLRTAGLITESGDLVALTEAGVAAAGGVEPLPEGPALLEFWREKLGGSSSAPRRIFEALVAAFPNGMERGYLAERAGIDQTTSTLRNALSELRRYDLMDEEHGWYFASRTLMEAAR